MNQQAVERHLVVVVGASGGEPELELLLCPMGLSVARWHEGLDPVWRAVAPRLVVAHFSEDDLPALDRLEAIRAAFPGVPLLALTAPGDGDLARALRESGVTSLLGFPAAPAEFRARVADLLGRASGLWSLPLPGLDFALDQAGFVARLGDVEAHLTKSEFAIFAYFAEKPGRWISADDVLRDVLGPNHAAGTSLVRVHVHNMRRKLGPMAQAISVQRGKGYRLALGSVDSEALDSDSSPARELDPEELSA
jgi:two-component system, OmpR family, response regulator QseB